MRDLPVRPSCLGRYVEGMVRNYSAHGIPLAHVVIENYYQSGHELQNTSGSFPDPKGMVRVLAAGWPHAERVPTMR